MVSEELLVLRAVADDVVQDMERYPHYISEHLIKQHNVMQGDATKVVNVRLRFSFLSDS